MPKRQRIAAVRLDEATMVRRRAEVEHERAVAIYDIVEDNHFAPVGDFHGPYSVVLSLSDNRLVFDIGNEADQHLLQVTLPLKQFQSLIKDYFIVCESYYDAIKTATSAQIEAIDMGRRALHNEGSVLLRERLAGKVTIDHDTARRLFTLICVLHIRG